MRADVLPIVDHLGVAQLTEAPPSVWVLPLARVAVVVMHRLEPLAQLLEACGSRGLPAVVGKCHSSEMKEQSKVMAAGLSRDLGLRRMMTLCAERW